MLHLGRLFVVLRCPLLVKFWNATLRKGHASEVITTLKLTAILSYSCLLSQAKRICWFLVRVDLISLLKESCFLSVRI